MEWNAWEKKAQRIKLNPLSFPQKVKEIEEEEKPFLIPSRVNAPSTFFGKPVPKKSLLPNAKLLSLFPKFLFPPKFSFKTPPYPRKGFPGAFFHQKTPPVPGPRLVPFQKQAHQSQGE